MSHKPKDIYIYVLGDGDKVRDIIENHLFSGNLDSLTRTSESLIEAILDIKNHAITTMKAEIIMAGGDDFFFRVVFDLYSKNHLIRMSDTFRDKTGIGFSFGVGTTIDSAYLNLRKAKASGSGNIVEEAVIS